MTIKCSPSRWFGCYECK